MFQIPVGEHPFKPGTYVVSQARPWWGVGKVLCPDGHHSGRFTVQWADGLVTHGQVAELDLRETDETPVWPPKGYTFAEPP